MALSDEDLFRGCGRGEESAWEALVRRYQRLVYAVPRRAGLDSPNDGGRHADAPE